MKNIKTFGVNPLSLSNTFSAKKSLLKSRVLMLHKGQKLHYWRLLLFIPIGCICAVIAITQTKITAEPVSKAKTPYKKAQVTPNTQPKSKPVIYYKKNQGQTDWQLNYLKDDKASGKMKNMDNC